MCHKNNQIEPARHLRDLLPEPMFSNFFTSANTSGVLWQDVRARHIIIDI